MKIYLIDFYKLKKESIFTRSEVWLRIKTINGYMKLQKKNPFLQFVVAGKIDLQYWGMDEKNIQLKNIVYTGYISDEENVALMNNCKAYIHPSKYEGFGIPPLEALALGKKVIVSNATCLPEIFGNAVEYLDPDNFDFDFSTITWNENNEGKEQVLNEHTWEKSAEKWNKLIRDIV